MRSVLLFPLLYVCLASFSLTILASIAPNLFVVQLIAFLLGGSIFYITTKIPFHTWKRVSPMAYATILLLLITTLVIGNVTRGSTSWIPLGPVNFQPSQFAKPITILLLSVFLGSRSMKVTKNLLQYLAIGLAPLLLIMLEPDLGTALVLMSGVFGLLAVSDVPLKWIGSGIVAFAVLAVISWSLFLQPYQKDRITSFIQPTDLQGAGYNAQQSLIAVGSGTIWGRGLGHGVQSHLRFLPERHTDFIFASMAEETGFMGSLLLLFLYICVIAFGLRTMFYSLDPVKQYLCAGILILFITQMFINIGMNIGILPITGITLPLLSYGGSSILAFSFYFGLLQRVVIEDQLQRGIYLSTTKTNSVD